MTKFVSALIILLIVLGLFTSCKVKDASSAALPGKPVVYASFYPMYDFAKKAAGDLAEVHCLIPDGTEPHDWEPSPKDIAALEKADLFVYSSESFETWAKPVIANIKNEKLSWVEASVYSSYSGGDPHTWLSPVEARLQFVAICDGLKAIDPENADKYEANKARWAEEFGELDAEYSVLRGQLSQNKILVTHAAFGHLCAAYGLEQIPVVDSGPDSEPDPARMAEVVYIAKENGITTVFYEEIEGEKLAMSIAKEIDGKTAPLSPLEGLTDEQRKNGDDYFSVMRKNLAVLREALK